MLVTHIAANVLGMPIVKLAPPWCKLASNFESFFYLNSTDFRRRIFILGPSHHVRLRGCALSIAKIYKTPFYDLTVDTLSMLKIFL